MGNAALPAADGLAGDVQRLSQLLLRPAPTRAEGYKLLGKSHVLRLLSL